MNLPTKVIRDKDVDLKPAQRLNFIDRTVAFFNPEAGVMRMAARQQLFRFGYNDHVERRGKPGVIGTTTGESWMRNRDRMKAMADARDAAAYDWIGGVIAKVVLYVCGTIHSKSITGDEQIDLAYDDYFHGWCGDERSEDGLTRCDITGRHRFSKQVQIALLAFLVDGDHGFIEVDPTASPTGEFCLQHIEADRIGSPLEATTEEDYIGGIKIDVATGRIIFYRVYHRTRAGMYQIVGEIEPSNFIHVFDADRSDDYRGRTKLMRCLNDLRDIREWIDAEKQAGKTQSQWAAMIGVKDPGSKVGPAAWSGQTPAGTPTQDAMWGKILKMAEGENFSMMSPSARPSGAFMQFVQTLIRKMAVSLNLPYGFLWDLASLGGVTARIEVQGALRQIQYWQNNILESLILNRVRQKVIAQGIATGVLPPTPNWKKCEWHYGPWITTDAGYEMDSDIQGMNAGIIPISNVSAKHGMNPREVFLSNATTANEAVTVGEETQLPVEVFAKGLYPDITEQKASIINPPKPPEPGSIEAISDKGVGKLIEVLEKVGDGTIDRESGIQTLITSFGISPAKAQKLVPQEPTKRELDDEAERNKPAAPAGGKVVKSTPKKK